MCTHCGNKTNLETLQLLRRNMRNNQSPFEDFVDVMSKIPWWLNIVLAVIAYVTLHEIAMTFYDPAPKLEIGQLGEYAADKMKGSLALFGQFVIPFGFLLAGLIGLIKKFKKTGNYKELVIYIIINVIFFGSVISKDGGTNNSIKKRLINPPVKENIKQSEVSRVDKSKSSDAENEVKALQGILSDLQGKQSGKKEEEIIYSWVNEKGQKVYSNQRPSR
jgi:hypothetical protein